MLPERPVWIFVIPGAQLPGGAFTSREAAEVWIAARRLTGTLTAHPLDEGAFNWTLRTSVVTGRFAHVRAETVAVEVVVPGERWDVEVFADGTRQCATI